MRREQFGWPLEGWAYGENGEIFTTSGYTTSAQHIESALWLLGIMMRSIGPWTMPSDTRPGATRALLEHTDFGERFSGKKARQQSNPCAAEVRTRPRCKANP